MSVRNSARAVPTLLRVGFAEAMAYRAELLVWVLSTTMPLIMLALWSAVAQDAPVGRFGQSEFTAYFLATFMVRQLTSTWAAWQMNYEVRHGLLSMRLLRPIHPVIAYAVENIAALPLRLVVAIPAAVVILWVVGTRHLPSGATGWVAWVVSLIGAWTIGFFVNVVMGCLSFYLQSSLRLMDVWLAMFFVFSGYIIPIEIFPSTLRTIADWMPFRYQLGLPVEVFTGSYPGREVLPMLARQWGYVVFLGSVLALVWRRGLRRYEAYGG